MLIDREAYGMDSRALLQQVVEARKDDKRVILVSRALERLADRLDVLLGRDLQVALTDHGHDGNLHLGERWPRIVREEVPKPGRRGHFHLRVDGLFG